MRRKVNVWSIIICKETLLKACELRKPRAATTPINSRMNHVAEQLIFKIIRIQKFSILVLKFKQFLKNIFK